MRVVAGTVGGRRLMGPPTEATRPTTDKVREAVFNSLNSAMALDNATVLDLYAGTGACGIEALSRGAASATFVENDRAVVNILNANLRATGFESQGRVIRGDAIGFVSSGSTFDLAFADPPYKFSNWAGLLDRVDAKLLVCESNRSLEAHVRWTPIRERRYGTTVITFLELSDRTSQKKRAPK